MLRLSTKAQKFSRTPRRIKRRLAVTPKSREASLGRLGRLNILGMYDMIVLYDNCPTPKPKELINAYHASLVKVTKKIASFFG